MVVFTDRLAEHAYHDVELCDASELIRAAFAHPYRHRLKPLVLAEALRRFDRPCVLMDTDSFALPGFPKAVARALHEGAAMNFFVRDDPYPDFPTFETNLPHIGSYRLDPTRARMLNSGLVAVRPEHLPLVEDAVALIDRFWAGGLMRHDIEQFAIAECLRFGGVEITLIDDVFVHYCARWAKRYMRRRLRSRGANAPISYGKAQVRRFKAYWTARLAMRKAGRAAGKAIGAWRRT